MKVEIDPDAGFCFGVEKAILSAEDKLLTDKELYCLGNIVHNEIEMERLSNLGMKTIDHQQLRDLKNTTVLIRAHGEPPATYVTARQNNITLIEATCPIVRKLQSRIVEAYHRMKAIGGLVIIAGKKNHPEVIGLNGGIDNQGIVIESVEELEVIDPAKPVELFAQTTLGYDIYKQIADRISIRLTEAGTNPSIRIHQTICGQVSGRAKKLAAFCRKHEIILFVSGKNSSNGRYLFSVCKESNPKSYCLSSSEELQNEWLAGAISVGISGATSTPLWLMRSIAQQISQE